MSGLISDEPVVSVARSPVTEPPELLPPRRPDPVDKLAKASLIVALSIAIIGLVIKGTGVSVFWGGLLFALGEAGLVGGLADWFAVRALFEQPLGIPFHTAIVPRNRKRIVQEIRGLVQNEWLTVSMLTDRVKSFDFVEAILRWVRETGRGELGEALRTFLRRLVTELPISRVAEFIGAAGNRTIDVRKLEPLLANLALRARTERWLDPVLREWLRRMEEWVHSDDAYHLIHGHLLRISTAYRDQGFFKRITFRAAEVLGGVNVADAARLIQAEIATFVNRQQMAESELSGLADYSLEGFEKRLLDDPDFQAKIRQFFSAVTDESSLQTLLLPIVDSFHKELVAELNKPESRIIGWGVQQIENWVERVANNEQERDSINLWCHGTINDLIEKHHSMIGSMVEDQLNRFTDDQLVRMIEDKAGADLNWIRINGAIVGGFVGASLFLIIWFVEHLILKA